MKTRRNFLGLAAAFPGFIAFGRRELVAPARANALDDLCTGAGFEPKGEQANDPTFGKGRALTAREKRVCEQYLAIENNRFNGIVSNNTAAQGRLKRDINHSGSWHEKTVVKLSGEDAVNRSANLAERPLCRALFPTKAACTDNQLP